MATHAVSIGVSMGLTHDELSLLNRATRIVYTHHERYDGKGYPRGLCGAELCIFSCIIAVADTIDAMTAGRAYRTIATMDEVVDELKRERGKQFHSEVVDAFVGVIEWV